jgi:hypothetical protein
MAISKKKHFLENWRFRVIISRKIPVNKLQSPFFQKKISPPKNNQTSPFLAKFCTKTEN